MTEAELGARMLKQAREEGHVGYAPKTTNRKGYGSKDWHADPIIRDKVLQILQQKPGLRMRDIAAIMDRKTTTIRGTMQAMNQCGEIAIQGVDGKRIATWGLAQ